MKFNKIALAAAVVLGTISSVQAADQGNGVVKFTGTVIDAPCAIDQKSSDQTIDLGSVANVALADGGSSGPKAFEVRLEKCSLATAKTVKTTFSGAESAGGLLGITGTAKGAGIALADGDGNSIKLGTPTAGKLLGAGTSETTLAFTAALKGSGGNVSTIVPGEFSSVANFMLTYN